MTTDKMNLLNLRLWCLLFYFVGRTRQVGADGSKPNAKHAKLKFKQQLQINRHKNPKLLIHIASHQPLKIDFPMRWKTQKHNNKKKHILKAINRCRSAHLIYCAIAADVAVFSCNFSRSLFLEFSSNSNPQFPVRICIVVGVFKFKAILLGWCGRICARSRRCRIEFEAFHIDHWIGWGQKCRHTGVSRVRTEQHRCTNGSAKCKGSHTSVRPAKVFECNGNAFMFGQSCSKICGYQCHNEIELQRRGHKKCSSRWNECIVPRMGISHVQHGRCFRSQWHRHFHVSTYWYWGHWTFRTIPRWIKKSIYFLVCLLHISSYRKFNLFGDNATSQTTIADRSTFTTDFNVTFGLIICFDIIMETPAIDLVKRGVRNFIMPTMWYSELPFLSSKQQLLFIHSIHFWWNCKYWSIVENRSSSAAIMGVCTQRKLIGCRHKYARWRLLWFGHLLRPQWSIECRHQWHAAHKIADRLCANSAWHNSTENHFI